MRISVFAVPYDSGWRDVRMGRGPARLLEGGLEAAARAHGHDVRTELVELPAGGTGDAGGEVGRAFALTSALAVRVRAESAAGRFPLVLAGNCGATIGALAGLGPADTGLVWFDAHADFNTPETSASGFLDGMALAILTGRCWRSLAATVPGFVSVPDRHVVLVGARDLDLPEARALAESGIRRVAADLVGLDAAVPADSRRAYLHIDLDVLDLSEGRANQFAVAGGLTVLALQSAVRRVAARAPIVGAALTAYDPTCDPEGRIVAAALAVVETLADVVGGGDLP